MSEVNNTQVDDVHDIDVVMPMYNLIEYSDIYLMNQLQTIIALLLIFLLITVMVFRSNLKKK